MKNLKLFENQGAIKIIWETEIWKLEFWKLKFWKLFENWSFGNYLKIGALKIIWKLKFWTLNLEIEVLKIRILKKNLFENGSSEN